MILEEEIEIRTYGYLAIIFLIVDVSLSATMIILEIAKSVEQSIILFFYIALPWTILFLVLFEDLSFAFEKFFKELEALPITQKVFYIALFYFLTFIFLIPIATPFLGLMFSIVFPFILATKIRRKSKELAILMFILLSTALSAIVFQILLSFYIFYIENVLEHLIPTLLLTSYYFYEIAIIIGASSAIADFILLIYEGASIYDPSVQVPYRKIKIFQFILIALFGLLNIIFPNFYRVLVICFVSSIIAFLIRRVKGLYTKKELNLTTIILYILYTINSISESGIVINYFYITQPPDVLRFYTLLYAYIVSWVYLLLGLKRGSVCDVR